MLALWQSNYRPIHVRHRRRPGDDGRIFHDTVFVRDLGRDDVAIHMGGDRECRKELSGFHGKILKYFDFDMSCDTSFLDKL